MSDIDIEIDGKKITIAQGAMVIEAADAAGIHIPRFCYHKKLSVAANCRMCLVEIDKMPKPLPACATPVAAGMKVFTQSAKAVDAQKAVMEFLLINHPLDCPICDQGGACELQDLSLGYGQDFSRYEETKRVVKDENLGSLISTDMTRCIQCTRCVRFGQEIAGVRELGTLHRGDRTEIGSYLKENAVKSELSGNIIDLCPVGALTSKPFRYQARPWELNQYASIAPHDNVGANIFVQTLRQKVMRIVPRENEQINETWLADRDRFSYQALYSDDRLLTPIYKKNGEWIETDWQTALALIAEELTAISQQWGGESLAALATPNATLEEFYLLNKLMRSLGSTHVDHRLHQIDAVDEVGLPISIEDLQTQEVILLIGSHLNHEQPLLAHRLRKAFLQGAKIMVINSIDFAFAFGVAAKAIVAPSQLLNAVVNAGSQWIDLLQSPGKKIILLGELAFNHPQARKIVAAAKKIAQQYQMQIGYLTTGANSNGAAIAKAIMPTTAKSYSALEALQAQLKSYVLLGFEPDRDCADPVLAQAALAQAQFVVALSAYRSPTLLKYAQVILPIAPFTETAGTFVNIAGDWQSFAAITAPLAESKPVWKILRVLGNLLALPEFTYETTTQVTDEIKKLWQQLAPATTEVITGSQHIEPSLSKEGQLERIAEWPIYQTDMLVRRGYALQHAAANENVALHVHPETAAAHQLTHNQTVTIRQNENQATLVVQLDITIPHHCGMINAGFAETASLSQLFGYFTVDSTYA